MKTRYQPATLFAGLLTMLLALSSAVTAQEETYDQKPDPEIYLKVQQTLGVAPHESIAFEDSEHGLNSAKNAAMYGIAIPNEFTLDHDFSRADLILNSLTDMDDDKIASLLRSPP